MHVCKYTSMQESKYERLKLCKILSLILQPCEYATIWVCDNQLLPHSGPIREFQLSLKSCNLAGWTAKWNDYVTRYDNPLIPDYNPLLL